MTIAPVRHMVHTKAAPKRAFELFTTRMGEWWPKGRTIGKNPHVAFIIEPHVEGRWFERDADGKETQWGKVLIWDPSERLVLAWQLNAQNQYDANFVTEVELTFAPAADGGSDVTLEHRNLERFGQHAARQADAVGAGWSLMVVKFAEFLDLSSEGK